MFLSKAEMRVNNPLIQHEYHRGRCKTDLTPSAASSSKLSNGNANVIDLVNRIFDSFNHEGIPSKISAKFSRGQEGVRDVLIRDIQSVISESKYINGSCEFSPNQELIIILKPGCHFDNLQVKISDKIIAGHLNRKQLSVSKLGNVFPEFQAQFPKTYAAARCSLSQRIHGKSLYLLELSCQTKTGLFYAIKYMDGSASADQPGPIMLDLRTKKVSQRNQEQSNANRMDRFALNRSVKAEEDDAKEDQLDASPTSTRSEASI